MTTQPRTTSWPFIALCLLSAFMLVAAYSNSLDNSFHFDDSHVVEGNAYIRSLTNFKLFFTDGSTSSSFPPNAMYRPVMTASLALDYWAGEGLKPNQFHLTQITLLLILAILLFFFFETLANRTARHPWNPYIALAAASLFALHTTNTETMNIIAVRAELLSAIGVVAAFLAYFHSRLARRTYLYLLPMAFGAFAKSPAVIFAPLLLAYMLLYEQQLTASELLTGKGWKKVWTAGLKSAPSFAVGVGLFLLMESMNGPAATYAGGNRLYYAQTQAFIWLHYGRLFLLPIGLTADTDWGLIQQWYDTRVLAGLAFIGLLLSLLWRTMDRPAFRASAFGLSWFMLALLPGSSILPFAEVTNEHRMFFPYIGLTMAVVWAVVRWAQTRIAHKPASRRLVVTGICALACLAIVGNALGTYERNKVWRTEETLWKDVSEKSPGNGRGLMNYGVALMGQGRYDEAKALFERAATLLPIYDRPQINLGIIYGRSDPAEATRHFTRALELAPNDPVPHYFYANWLIDQNRTAEAVPLLERAVMLSSADLQSRHRLLTAYLKVGREDDAKKLAADTLNLVPDDPVARSVQSGELNSSSAGLTAKPQAPAANTADGLLSLSLARYQQKDFPGSIDAARKALELKPDFAEAYSNIAAANASLGKWDEAIQAADEALRIKPDFELAKNNRIWAETGKRSASQTAR